MDPVRLVELAFQHDVGQWLERAYVSLCTRPHPLTQPEVTRIGHGVANKVGRCRAKLIMADRDMPTARTSSENEELVRGIVREVFWPYGPPA